MDPPPPYHVREPSRHHNPETSSIRSTAPSYVSVAPSYTSMFDPPTSASSSSGLPSPYSSQNGLPSSNSSSGMRNIRPSLEHYRKPHAKTPSLMTPIPAPQARAFTSIAARRAAETSAATQATILLAAISPDPISALTALQQRAEDSKREKAIQTLEDPELVGDIAAEENRKLRELKERGNQILEDEDRRWEWMLAQMQDWEERERSWGEFKINAEMERSERMKKKLFGARKRK